MKRVLLVSGRAVRPRRLRHPFGIGCDVRNKDEPTARGDTADLPDAEGKATKLAVGPRPILLLVVGNARPSRQVQATRLVRAFVAEVVLRADASCRDWPGALERDVSASSGFFDKPSLGTTGDFFHDSLQHVGDGSLFGNRDHHILRGIHFHEVSSLRRIVTSEAKSRNLRFIVVGCCASGFKNEQ